MNADALSESAFAPILNTTIQSTQPVLTVFPDILVSFVSKNPEAPFPSTAPTSSAMPSCSSACKESTEVKAVSQDSRCCPSPVPTEIVDINDEDESPKIIQKMKIKVKDFAFFSGSSQPGK